MVKRASDDDDVVVEKLRKVWSKNPIWPQSSDAPEENVSDPTILVPDFSGTVVASLKPPVANPNQLEKIPSKELTGVDEVITVLCANLCQQIRKAPDKSYFNLTVDGVNQGQVILMETHGGQDCIIPAFVVPQHTILFFSCGVAVLTKC
jgi:hypothetical protein